MLRAILFIICLVFIVSCNSQKRQFKEKRETNSHKIIELIGIKNFNTLINTKIIIQFDIKKKLIEGTLNEYSNKLILIDTLKHAQTNMFLEKLRNDSFYDWNNLDIESSFEPNKQFLLKGNEERLTLLLDEKKNTLGFTSLDGQKLIRFAGTYQ
ncbi:hypothetical protein [Maribacter sp. R77961]|uniref:hypothetical protein n=1 Tax=Maribacter sp. R77961 TaxID=3093871 RepID=UPI0037CC8B79